MAVLRGDRDQSNDFFLIFQFFFMRDSETMFLGTFDCIFGSLKFS